MIDLRFSIFLSLTLVHSLSFSMKALFQYASAKMVGPVSVAFPCYMMETYIDKKLFCMLPNRGNSGNWKLYLDSCLLRYFM